jgi:outer membrane protein assembly factor BamE
MPFASRLVFLPLLALFLASCSVTDKITPYKIDIQQGNVVTQEMVAKLKPGMTRSQVRFILGTPLVTDVFHGDRWDYVYRYQKAGKLVEERRLALFFEKDLLKRVEGDVVPASGEGKANGTADSSPAGGQPGESGRKDEMPAPSGDKTAGREEKGFFGKIMEKIGF